MVLEPNVVMAKRWEVNQDKGSGNAGYDIPKLAMKHGGGSMVSLLQRMNRRGMDCPREKGSSQLEGKERDGSFWTDHKQADTTSSQAGHHLELVDRQLPQGF